jgi:hypothetical protein
MNIFITNFLRRLGDFLHRNRAGVIKWVIILAAVLIGAWLIIYAIERLQTWSYDRGAAAKNLEIKALEDKAKEAEGRADVLRRALEIRYAYQHELEKRAEVAEAKLRDTKARVVTLKEAYETIRYVPVAGPVSCESACSELAAIGFPCK